jgi:hypothetical protein
VVIKLVVLCVETDKSIIVNEFFKKTCDNLQEKDIIKNAYKGGVTTFITNESILYAVRMKPRYPPLYLIGIVYSLSAFVINSFSWTWWVLPGLLLSLTGIFYSGLFLKIMLRKSLRKKNYTGRLKFLSCKRFVERLF